MGHDLGVVHSLNMLFSKDEQGNFAVLAPWMHEPIVRPTFESAYWAALAARHEPIPVKNDAE